VAPKKSCGFAVKRDLSGTLSSQSAQRLLVHGEGAGRYSTSAKVYAKDPSSYEAVLKDR
jgi:hypothetical protein